MLLKYKEKNCVTCQAADKATPVKLVIDNQERVGRFVSTVGKVPEWYTQEGIYSSLPRQFTCDKRYHAPLEMHEVAEGHNITLSTRGTSIPPDATIAYWAAQPSDTVTDAAHAYKDFSNGGIVQCTGSLCSFKMHLPGRYEVDGVVYPSHFHLTQWTGDQWNTVGRTVNIDET